MKQFFCLLLAVLLLTALFTGCVRAANPHDPTVKPSKPTETAAETESAQTGATETEPVGSSEAPEEPERFDMKSFLEQFVAAHPEANAKELSLALLEDSYFTMFQQESTEFYFPGLNFEYTPKQLDEASCVVDYMSGSGALVYFFVPEQGADSDALCSELLENAQPDWMDYEHPLDQVEIGMLRDDLIYLAMYRGDMKPVEGPIAEKAEDFIEMFRAYLAEHPEAGCLELAQYLAGHQKLCSMYTEPVAEGQLVGFGDMEHLEEIKGFSDGALFNPQISPSTLIGYVFRSSGDSEAFMTMLRENANLNWNICVSADKVVTEAEGDMVLFMMCSEN